MRAFRPSYFSLCDTEEEVVEQARQANVLIYRERVRAGLPLFESVGTVAEVKAEPSEHRYSS